MRDRTKVALISVAFIFVCSLFLPEAVICSDDAGWTGSKLRERRKSGRRPEREHALQSSRKVWHQV